MRWTKHLSMAHADAALALLLEEYGAEAYGVYWLMIEDIAAPMEKEKLLPVATHSWVKWSQICHCSVRVFKSIACRMEEKSLINIKSIDDRLQIEIPNILKYKDEYAKKSGQTPEQEQIQKEIQKEKELKPLTPADAGTGGAKAPAKVAVIKPQSESEKWFHETFWPLYPRKAAKEASLKAARKLQESERMAAMFGLAKQLPEMHTRDPSKIPHAATWLNGRRWEDEPTPLFADKSPNFYESATERAIRIGHERIRETGRL